MKDAWNVHKHKDELHISSMNTIYHLERGQLCQYDINYDAIIYYPIRFNDKSAAWKWIKDGCIADIQESLHNLQVGFSVIAFQKRTDRF